MKPLIVIIEDDQSTREWMKEKIEGRFEKSVDIETVTSYRDWPKHWESYKLRHMTIWLLDLLLHKPDPERPPTTLECKGIDIAKQINIYNPDKIKYIIVTSYFTHQNIRLELHKIGIKDSSIISKDPDITDKLIDAISNLLKHGEIS